MYERNSLSRFKIKEFTFHTHSQVQNSRSSLRRKDQIVSSWQKPGCAGLPATTIFPYELAKSSNSWPSLGVMCRSKHSGGILQTRIEACMACWTSEVARDQKSNQISWAAQHIDTYHYIYIYIYIYIYTLYILYKYQYIRLIHVYTYITYYTYNHIYIPYIHTCAYIITNIFQLDTVNGSPRAKWCGFEYVKICGSHSPIKDSSPMALLGALRCLHHFRHLPPQYQQLIISCKYARPVAWYTSYRHERNGTFFLPHFMLQNITSNKSIQS